MLKAKKKLSKKELKQDQFVLATLQAKSFVETHSRTITYALVGVLALLVLGYFYFQSKANAETAASTLLTKAQLELQTGQRENAVNIYQEIIDQYDGTDAAAQANFHLGRMYWEDNNLTLAKQYFQAYLDEASDDNILTQAALAGLADCYFAEKNFSEAAKLYERAARIEPDFPQADAYLYSAAQAYREAGNTAKARALAQKLIDESDDPQIKNRAEILRNSL